jgi:hypothetical protein
MNSQSIASNHCDEPGSIWIGPICPIRFVIMRAFLLDLPADPPMPQTPAIEVLRGRVGSTSARDGAAFLSQLMFYSASISASKRVAATGDIYALRVNPSSGNLHPTEFHFCTRGLLEWPDGLYHYRPSSHMAEQRGIGDFVGKLVSSSAPLVFVLTSIAWRKLEVGGGAYRYCLHDIRHAWRGASLRERSDAELASDALTTQCRNAVSIMMNGPC